TAASAVFRLRQADGTTIRTAERSIPAKGQLSVVLGQIFPNSSAGWFSADIDADHISAFWLGGDFVNSTDAAKLVTSSEAIAYSCFTFFSRKSEISFVNLGTATLTGNLCLVNSSGTAVAGVAFSVPAMGLYQRSVAYLFPPQAAGFDSSGF